MTDVTEPRSEGWEMHRISQVLDRKARLCSLRDYSSPKNAQFPWHLINCGILQSSQDVKAQSHVLSGVGMCSVASWQLSEGSGPERHCLPRQSPRPLLSQLQSVSGLRLPPPLQVSQLREKVRSLLDFIRGNFLISSSSWA